MEVGLVRKVDIDQEMQQSYLDYAMSVIIARALPDARDGLKPVQRRILYAMYDMGLRPSSGYKKSARIIGEVLGKYHPHGDMAVYEAMARLAQDFSMRYPLVDGQGNFGSVDGDPPAAMRYTEASLLPLAMEILQQIDRNTVDFTQNFDGTLEEPLVLPSAMPNLLLNGANGIAVGMATNIPPHNLGELVDAMRFVLSNWDHLDEINVSDLMKYVQGPDFPTGGIIIQESNTNDLLTAYATGRGRITVRGRVQMEEMGRGKNRILVTELPYMTNKSALIERIAELVREGKIEGISDVRDESDRHGIRVVIELSKTAETDDVLRDLYKLTPLQSTFGINLLALVDGEPRLLSLKQAIRIYLDHRIEVVKRRSEFDLEKAKQRAHILEGLRIAINNLDEIIAIIRKANDTDQARERLMKRFKLSQVQANAILDMPLRRLSALERKKIETEYREVMETIRDLEGLLRSPKKIRQVVESELVSVKERFNDRRRTQIISLGEGMSKKTVLTTKSVVPAADVWVGVMPDGQIGKTLEDKLPRFSGRHAPQWLMKTNTHHTLYIVSEDGKASSLSLDNLPVVEKFSEGIHFSRVCALQESDIFGGFFSIPLENELSGDRYLMTVSRMGMIKKTALSELPGPSSQTFTLAKVNPDDALIKILLTDGQSDIVLVTALGMLIRFSEKDVRPMGLVAAGVNGIKLTPGDTLIGAERFIETNELLLVAADGGAWRLPAKELPVQGRYGSGIKACKLRLGNELVGILVGKATQGGILHYQKAAASTIRLDEIITGKRTSSAKPLTEVKKDDSVYTVTPIWDSLSFWSEKPILEPKKRVRKSAPKPNG